MRGHFANYHEERSAFRQLYDDDCSKRILLLEGSSGSGKTSLLKNCTSEQSRIERTISIELRASSVNVSEIFSRTANRLGWNNLEEFSHCAKQLGSTAPNIALSGVHQEGETNSLRVALTVKNPDEREHRQTLLTDALFSDIRRLRISPVMVFDTYEQAPTEVKNWLSGPFLSRTADCSLMRVAIAGQIVPVAGIEWHHCYIHHGLYGISEASEWLPLVTSLGKQVPVEPAHTWLAGICHALRGQPSEIMKIIEALPNCFPMASNDPT